jgi:hypothetical protein
VRPALYALTILIAGLSAASAVNEPQTALAIARRDAGELANRFRALLSAELSKAGFAAAIRVCSEAAQEKTEAFTEQTGRPIRRISLKYRNPAGKPDAFERSVLRKMERMNRNGQLPPDYEFARVRSEKGERYLAYLKPVTIQPMCLACHGTPEEIDPEVWRILKERYPGDRATGYKNRDLRGAISVKVPLPPR